MTERGASRLDNSHDTEMRKLLRVDLLIVDDFALRALDPLDTADIYDYAAPATMPRSVGKARPRGASVDGWSA